MIEWGAFKNLKIRDEILKKILVWFFSNLQNILSEKRCIYFSGFEVKFYEFDKISTIFIEIGKRANFIILKEELETPRQVCKYAFSLANIFLWRRKSTNFRTFRKKLSWKFVKICSFSSKKFRKIFFWNSVKADELWYFFQILTKSICSSALKVYCNNFYWNRKKSFFYSIEKKKLTTSGQT